MVSCTYSCRLLHHNSNWCWRTAKTSRLRITGFKLRRRWWEQQVVTKSLNKFCPATSALSARTAKVPLLLRVQHLGKSLPLARCWRDISPSCSLDLRLRLLLLPLSRQCTTIQRATKVRQRWRVPFGPLNNKALLQNGLGVNASLRWLCHIWVFCFPRER